jgi:hypothetical protein
MGMPVALKKFYSGFFELLESGTVSLSDFGLKHARRWRCRYQDMLPTDTLKPQDAQAARKFWRQYTSDFQPMFHKLYSSRYGQFDVRYIPDDLFYTRIGPFLNNRDYWLGIDDKNYYSLWYPEIRQPRTIVRKINGFFSSADYNLISVSEAIDLCSACPRLIIKPAIGTGGSSGILFWEQGQPLAELSQMLTSRNAYQDVIVQEIVEQHEQLNIIHPSSINTVRVMSLLFQGQVHILSSVLRMGVGGSRVDNGSVGGWVCGIQADGHLKEYGYSGDFIKFDRHPQGFEFRQGQVPAYDKILDVVKRMQGKMCHFRLISWDIAVDREGEPVLIEANLYNGAANIHQVCNGPLFGDLTEAVLSEVFGK